MFHQFKSSYSFQLFGNEIDLNVEESLQIPCFSRYFERVYLSQKKPIERMSLPIERMTCCDIFHKNLQVTHYQILRCFLCSFIGLNHVASTSPPLATENQPGEGLKSRRTFSLAYVDVINHSFLIFFAWLTICIVELD